MKAHRFLAVAGAVAVGLLTVPSAAATTITLDPDGAVVTRAVAVLDEAPDPQFDIEVLRTGLLERPSLYVMTAEITLPPGGYVDWHTRPGNVTGIVLGGTLTILTHNCQEFEYPAGAAFYAPGGVQTARNHTEETVSLLGTFVLRGVRPVISVPDRSDKLLDERCGLAE